MRPSNNNRSPPLPEESHQRSFKNNENQLSSISYCPRTGSIILTQETRSPALSDITNRTQHGSIESNDKVMSSHNQSRKRLRGSNSYSKNITSGITDEQVETIDNFIPSANPSSQRTREGINNTANTVSTITHEQGFNFEVNHNSIDLSSINDTSHYDNDNIHKSEEVYWDIGDRLNSCEFCGAKMWYEERCKKDTRPRNPKFSLCCMQGKVQLPLLQQPPPVLYKLLHDRDRKSYHFRNNIRRYNMMFSFTSMGGKIDKGINNSRGPYTLKMHGQNMHMIGSLLPPDGSRPKFAQLYIYDTINEISNRLTSSSSTNDDLLDTDIVNDLKTMLDRCNPLVKIFRMAKDVIEHNTLSMVKIRLIRKRDKDGRRYNLPTTSEVAGLIVGDIGAPANERDIIIQYKSGLLERISELHPSYLPLQYPLLFPFGEDGYREDIALNENNLPSSRKRKRLTMRQFFAFRIQDRDNEPSTIIAAGKLFQQFLVDCYTMIESERLLYIRTHQKNLRADLYKGLADAVLRGETNPSSQGKRIVLPSSFTGGVRYTLQNYHDAMTICKWAGYPDLFITFTCNPKWPEVTRALDALNLRPEDRPDILARIFKIKLDQLMRDLKKKQIFGRVIAAIYTIEFQKRGLPHAHILLFLHHDDKYVTAADIDKIISAEIPDYSRYPALFDVVSNMMMHGPCGLAKTNAPCMVDNRCSKHFPKKFNRSTIIHEDGYPRYRRADNGYTVEKNGLLLDNRYVIPYNPMLLLRYRAHINVERCNQSRSIKYLFKYVSKGHDRATAAFYSQNENTNTEQSIDEIKMFYDCRYLSPSEAVWRVFGFDINFREPSVERLSFHLPDEHTVVFEDDEPLDFVVNRNSIAKSMFLAWLDANKKYAEARHLTYADFPTRFVYKANTKEWLPRKSGFSIGRLYYTPPGSGDRHYLRLLLNTVQGPTSYEDIRTVNGVTHQTFKKACYALGLLDDDQEYIDGIQEASLWGSADFLRRLFCTLLFSNSLAQPEVVWLRTWTLLSDDILHRQRLISNHEGLTLTDDELKNFTLIELEKILQRNGRSLVEFPSMPHPDLSDIRLTTNRLILDELNYDKSSLNRELSTFLLSLTQEQREIYDEIISTISSNKGGLFFVYGYGGTGKTFLWRTLSASLRSKGEIVLNVASSGIASLLLPGGRTAHSRFGIPLEINEDSICNIKQGSDLAELIVRTKLIIWDEAPMTNKLCFEAVDKSLRDIMRFSNPNSHQEPFGGKVVVFGGDFRQILPVIPRGTREDIVFASINALYLWDYCKVKRLTKNMRLQSNSQTVDNEEIRRFSQWVLDIGEGSTDTHNDGVADLQIPDDIIIKANADPICKIVESTYPHILENIGNLIYFQERAILTPTLLNVDAINNHIISMIPGEEKTYLSSDNVCKSDNNRGCLDDLYTTEFLNSIKMSGLPNHELKLKVGVPVMLLRNIDKSMGLCNGTRLLITRLGTHIIEADVISGDNFGQKVFIPRLTVTPSDTRLPFRLTRRQFPISICFAMSINKSQGQSLSNVGIYLPTPVFSHGQLYVAISRVRSKQGLKILNLDKDGECSNLVSNVVYKEIFQNIH